MLIPSSATQIPGGAYHHHAFSCTALPFWAQ